MKLFIAAVLLISGLNATSFAGEGHKCGLHKKGEKGEVHCKHEKKCVADLEACKKKCAGDEACIKKCDEKCKKECKHVRKCAVDLEECKKKCAGDEACIKKCQQECDKQCKMLKHKGAKKEAAASGSERRPRLPN